MYKTLRGLNIKHPLELQVLATKLKPESLREAAIEYTSYIRDMYDALVIAENEVIKLREENKRLTSENEFMYMLMNEE